MERVDERLANHISYNFNSIFDYQFTPESRLFVVLADSTDGESAVLTKYPTSLRPTSRSNLGSEEIQTPHIPRLILSVGVIVNRI